MTTRKAYEMLVAHVGLLAVAIRTGRAFGLQERELFIDQGRDPLAHQWIDGTWCGEFPVECDTAELREAFETALDYSARDEFYHHDENVRLTDESLFA